MRAALVRIVLAATSMVALAFVVPLGLVARQMAHDRAISDAHQVAASMVVAMAVSAEPATVTRAVAASPAATDQRLAVHLPDSEVIGSSRTVAADLRLVVDQGRAASVEVDGGLAYLYPTSVTPGETAVVEVYVPDDELRRGVAGAWAAMAGLAVILVLTSVVLADRFGARVVRAARTLASGARALGGRDFTARVRPSGPPELVEAGRAFNAMAGQIVALVDAERERAADLSHRLRTPLTALRLDSVVLPDGAASDRIREAIQALDEEIDAIIADARQPVAQPVTGRTDLVDVLAARLAFWTVLAEHQSRRWEVRGSDQPVWLDIARVDVTAAIDALLANVFRHTPPGTRFGVTVGGDALIVDDAGPGIADPAAALRRGVSGADSTGLGLDIVDWVAARAGGGVEIGRSPLGGARVVVRLGPGSLPSPDDEVRWAHSDPQEHPARH